MAGWFRRRYALPRLDAVTEVLPVNGTREALFAFAQAVIDRSRPGPIVVCPNPFYQIYEGAALLAGAEPRFLNQTADNAFDLELDSPDEEWRRTLYVCSPEIRLAECSTWTAGGRCSERVDRYGFVIASDGVLLGDLPG
jgi:N-succinyldiaminopimelate aminotransferase